MFSTVKWGRPKTIMMPQPLSDLEIWQVCAFIRKTAADHDTGDKAKREQLPPFQSVSYDMIRAGEPPGDWLTYSGNYAGYRHGIQTQIYLGQCSAPPSCLGGPTARRQSLSRIFPLIVTLQPHVRYRSAGRFDCPRSSERIGHLAVSSVRLSRHSPVLRCAEPRRRCVRQIYISGHA